MIVLIEQHNSHEHADLMDKMFSLRARIFRDRLGWDVQVTDGKERDRYDDEAAVYLIYTDDDSQEVKGSLRLLPTTGPTLLADFFSDSLPDGAQLSSPTIWECSRFCLDDKISKEDEMLFASGALISALGKLALKAGIETIIGAIDSRMLRLYRRIGCPVEVLGVTRRYERPVYLASCPITETIVRTVERNLEQ